EVVRLAQQLKPDVVLMDIDLPDLDGLEAPRSGKSMSIRTDRKSTRLNSSHGSISYAVFCLKKINRRRTHGLVGMLVGGGDSNLTADRRRHFSGYRDIRQCSSWWYAAVLAMYTDHRWSVPVY